MIRLWHLKAELAKDHPFEAIHGASHATLDAVWLVTLGSSVSTTQHSINLLASLPDLDLPAGEDAAIEFPKAPTRLCLGSKQSSRLAASSCL